MSNDNTALALALGAGTGLGLWYLLRAEKHNEQEATASEPGATASAGTTCSLRLDAKGLTSDGAPIDVPGAVAKCNAAGRADLVIADDAPSSASADLTTALGAAGILVNERRNARRPRGATRRQARPRFSHEGRTILRDGVAVVHLERVDLGNQRFALTPYDADVFVQKIVRLLNGAGRPRRQAAAAASAETPHRIFLFRTAPKNGNSRTRWYEANPPTTWQDAKRRLVTAGLLDERILLPTEWSLVTELPEQIRVPADRLRPLP